VALSPACSVCTAEQKKSARKKALSGNGQG